MVSDGFRALISRRPFVLGKVVGELEAAAGRRAPRRSPPPLCCRRRRRRPGSPLAPYFPSFVTATVNGRERARHVPTRANRPGRAGQRARNAVGPVKARVRHCTRAETKIQTNRVRKTTNIYMRARILDDRSRFAACPRGV